MASNVSECPKVHSSFFEIKMIKLVSYLTKALPILLFRHVQQNICKHATSQLEQLPFKTEDPLPVRLRILASGPNSIWGKKPAFQTALNDDCRFTDSKVIVVHSIFLKCWLSSSYHENITTVRWFCKDFCFEMIWATTQRQIQKKLTITNRL